jgi:hypothetical protein
LIFGTDAQAIRLQLFRNIRYTIRYHLGYDIDEKTYIIDTEYEVPFNEEIQHGKIFKGWSTKENSNKVEFKYGEVFSFSDKYRDKIIELYPIYEEYIFDYNKSTVLTLRPTNEQLYFSGT